MPTLYDPSLLVNQPPATATPSAAGGASAMGGMQAFLFAAQAVGQAYGQYEQTQAQKAIERVRRRIIASRAQEAEARQQADVAAE